MRKPFHHHSLENGHRYLGGLMRPRRSHNSVATFILATVSLGRTKALQYSHTFRCVCQNGLLESEPMIGVVESRLDSGNRCSYRKWEGLLWFNQCILVLRCTTSHAHYPCRRDKRMHKIKKKFFCKGNYQGKNLTDPGGTPCISRKERSTWSEEE